MIFGARRPQIYVPSGGVITDGLVARYKLDEGSGTTANDSVGTNHAEWFSTTVFPEWNTIDGPFGPGSPNVYIPEGNREYNFRRDDFLTTISGAQPRTICCWLYQLSSRVGSINHIWSIGEHAVNQRFAAVLTVSPRPRLLGWNRTTNFEDLVPVESWYFLALMFDGTTWDNSTCWANGAYNPLDSGPTDPPQTVSSRLVIGHYRGNDADKHPGYISDLRFYDRVLTEAELMQIEAGNG